MSSEWIDDLEDKIFSRVKSKTMSKLKKTYPDLNFTTEDNVNNITKFPSVYMYFDFNERMKTLDIGGINGIMMSIRTRITVTEDQGTTVAKKVNSVVRDLLIDMGFGIDGNPIPTSSIGAKNINANYSRLIGQGDSIVS